MKTWLRIVLTCAVMCFVTIAHATDHVLIMAIGAYPDFPLDGVKRDVPNALELAKRLGFDVRQPTIWRDQQLTNAGMQLALEELKQRVRKNDRVFIHYSGHGTSVLRNGQCTQALVPIDVTPKAENLFYMDQLNDSLDAIKTLASEAVVLIDACHSGGLRQVAMRGAGEDTPAPQRLRAKAWTPRAGEVCHQPVNLVRQWGAKGAFTRGMTGPESNFVLIAAANEREVAFDDPDKGGLATYALTQCARNGVEDSDGSQGISVTELAECAQKRIDADVAKRNADEKNTRYKPQHIEVYGNTTRGIFLSAPLTSSPSVDRANRTLSAFFQIAAGSNGNWSMSVRTSDSDVVLGEKVGFEYSSAQPGYASVLYVGSDHKDIKALLTNKPIQATDKGSLGRTQISAPAGDNHFLVLFSHAPLNLDAVLKDGKVDISAVSLQSLHCATSISAKRNASAFEGDDAPCAGQKRNASDFEETGQVTGYAARVLSVRGR